MELYGRSTARNGSQPDRPAEWAPAGGETGLEESMRRLGLWNRENLYPERTGVPDCAYYMRTGSCGYGIKCRYNHPRDRSAVGGAVRIGGEYPERPSEPACQFYLRTGSCKFGASCKFHHPRNGGGSTSNVRVNSYGYPLRPGEKECSYYLKTGQCRFGITCKFHHPQLGSSPVPSPARSFYPAVQSSSNPSPEPYGGSSTSYRTGTGRPPLVPGSYVPGTYGPLIFPHGVVPLPGWSYSGPVSPALSPSAQPPGGTGSLYGVPHLSSSAPAFTGSYPSIPSPGVPSGSSQQERVFPERPGQPDCQYFLKTGDCKFGSACKFNHPPDLVVSKTNCALNAVGLPLRPGVQECSFYMKNGYCKFGSMCKFDHPIGPVRYSPSSASSLTDVPIAPYVVGPTPLASSSSVGLIYSQTGSSSLSDVQLSSQSSSSLAIGGISSTRQGSEARHSS